MNNIFKKAIQLIDTSQVIAIASHIGPDGDNIGSIMAIGKYLEAAGKEVHYLKHDNIPDYLLFLPGLEKFEQFNELLEPDLFIAVDCAEKKRLGWPEDVFKKSKRTINIDHHSTNTNFAEINIVDAEVSSTGELIFELLEFSNYVFDSLTAMYLFTAISTDTGRFLYESTSKRTLEIVAQLIGTGFDRVLVNKALWQSKKMSEARLYIDALSKVEFFQNNSLAISTISLKMASKYHADIEGTEDVINFIRDIDGIEVAVLIKEKKSGVYKVSLRSKEYVDVSNIALKFGGGGHRRAAGFTFYGNLNELQKQLYPMLTGVM